MLVAAALLMSATPTVGAQAAKVSEGWITMADGVRLWYRAYGGKGDTLVYLHGGPGGTLEDQLPDLADLADEHVFIGYDQRGGGRSEAGDTLKFTARQHVDDLDAVLRHFGVGQATIFGTSWGSQLAVMYAAAHPERVKRLVLMGPGPPARFPFGPERGASVNARILEMCRGMVTSGDTLEVQRCTRQPRMQMRAYYADTMNVLKSRGIRGAGLTAANTASLVAQRRTMQSIGDWDFRPLMRQVKAPALVVEGSQSPVPVAHQRVWAGSLANGRLLLVSKTGHAYPYLENPEEFFPAVRDFLKGRWPARAERIPADVGAAQDDVLAVEIAAVGAVLSDHPARAFTILSTDEPRRRALQVFVGGRTSATSTDTVQIATPAPAVTGDTAFMSVIVTGAGGRTPAIFDLRLQRDSSRWTVRERRRRNE